MMNDAASLTAALPVFLDSDEDAEATRWCTRALDEAPRLDAAQRDQVVRLAAAAGLLSLSEDRFAAGQVGGAASSCLKALALAPGLVDGWLLLVRVHHATGALGQARRCLARALSLINDLGDVPFANDWARQAIALRQALALD